MKLTWEYLVAVAALIVTLLLAWFGGIWLRLQGANLWILRLGIIALGVIGVIAFLLWAHSKLPQKSASAGQPPEEVSASDVALDDIDRLIREAQQKVASSRLGHGAKLSALPAIFLLGEAGSGKTSALLQCGLDPELLAGQVYREGSVVPTAVVNVWFARKTVFVDASGKLMRDPKPWSRIIHRLAPGRLGAIFGRRQQAPRAALLCFDCEKLLKPAGPDALLETAKSLRARLEEMARQLGVSFPVYALFCKLDQVPYFGDFVGSLKDEESTQVLGTTLPVSTVSGVYAEQETKRLSAAFQSLFASLADCRVGLLTRERDKNKQPGVYEFPRQFQKLRKPVVEFLVEVCRPSHLGAGPFLRGFYFVGRRMVASGASGAAALAAQTMVRPAADFSSSATSILRPEDLPKLGQLETGTMIQSPAEGRQVPQWVFLSHLFSQVLMQDGAASRASGASTKVHFWRRSLLVSVTVVAAILMIGFLVSFISNRIIESEVVSAAKGIRFGAPPDSSLPSVDEWKALDALRQPLQVLSAYQRDGAPLHLRWGLYSGSDTYAAGRAVYFARFRQLAFGQTQDALRTTLLQLPATPGQTDDYNSAYTPLKAYLITTSHPEKATRDFLTPALMKYWLAGRDLDDERKQLAQAQFDFYSDELKISNPYSSENDLSVVGRTRAYLAQFAATQRIYRAMLADASKANPSLNFNRKYPDAAPVVRDAHEIASGFTKPGWTLMQAEFQHADQYITGEEWVLGGTGGGSAVSATLVQDLRALYLKDYIQEWRDFLAAATVVRPASYQDEAAKLASLSGNRSPLLMVLCEASQNTAIDSPDIAKAFVPAQQVVPAPCQDRVVQPPSEKYVQDLNAAQTCLEQIPPTAPPEQRDAAVSQCHVLLGQARVAADQIAQNFPIDQEGKVDVTVKHLLEEPTTPAPPPPLPGISALGQVCDPLKALQTKYPFNAAASQEATLSDLTGFFQPGTGTLAKFLDQNKAVLDFQGSQYVQKGGKPNPGVLFVINRAAEIQRALYTGGSAQVQFKFTVKAHPQQEITTEVLTIEGQPLQVAGNEQGSKTIAWSGSGGESSLSINGISYGQFGGPWAAFHLFDNYTWTPMGTGFHLSWPVRGFGGQPARINGKAVVAEFDLESGSVPLFQRGYFSPLKCPAQ